ncbi:hypothetical protein [Kitasatospora sp. NPDC001527]|uniref:hypothetical protein n=1 Tax=Kitasatospora sp. NPDC001527 TaxID=3154519 RepID=UPI0033172F87
MSHEYTPEQIAYLNATEPDEPDEADQGDDHECYGIHPDPEGYRTCDGRPI